jgi:predicted Zn-dependent protease/outer membrane protein assembly factor BamD (BamD/ComL family)
MRTRRLAPVLLALAGLASRLPAQTISDPDLYGKSLKAAQEALAEYGVYDNPVELARVNRLGYELAQQSTYQKFPFTFTLVDMPVPNAVSLPGGQIFVTRGLLDLGLTDDMLANVLGHEIGHVVLEHYKHLERRATLMNILSNVLLAGVLIKSERARPPSGPQAPYDPRVGYQPPGGNRVEGVAAASLVLSELLLRSYSRENEDAADEEGQRLAAAAGYDPDGARQLWVVMESRAPQAREYGYWQTHPFPDERIRAATARRGTWKIGERHVADDYRQRTQTVLVNYLDRERPKLLKEARKQERRGEGRPDERREPPVQAPGERSRPKPPDVVAYLKQSSLATWPQGKLADAIRLDQLHALREKELAKPVLARDYGSLIRSYRKEQDAVRAVDPKSGLLTTIAAELKDFDARLRELYPQAVTVVRGGIFETAFLASFLSNFPNAKEVPQVALALGDAYSRLGNQTDAVAEYLAVGKQDPDSPEAKRARAGLLRLTPSLKELAALQQLVDQDRDPELQRQASQRLAEMVKSYDDVGNGAEYLRRFPAGKYVPEVISRLNVLADNLYGEVVLYQGVGDASKAIERINKILTDAPLSPAAARLRDRAVLTAQKTG